MPRFALSALAALAALVGCRAPTRAADSGLDTAPSTDDGALAEGFEAELPMFAACSDLYAGWGHRADQVERTELVMVTAEEHLPQVARALDAETRFELDVAAGEARIEVEVGQHIPKTCEDLRYGEVVVEHRYTAAEGRVELEIRSLEDATGEDPSEPFLVELTVRMVDVVLVGTAGEPALHIAELSATRNEQFGDKPP